MYSYFSKLYQTFVRLRFSYSDSYIKYLKALYIFDTKYKLKGRRF